MITSIKKENLQRIYHLIYDLKNVSKQDIATHLNLSLPTISQNLIDLENRKIIKREGFFKSTGGRKATVYQINTTYRYSISLNITKKNISVALVNLYDQIIQKEKYIIPFKNDDSYFNQLINIIQIFMQNIDLKQILGMGIAIQGLVSLDGSQVTYGEVLGCTGLDIECFKRHFPFPVYFIHDIEANALSHLWHNKGEDFIYLSLNDNLGGALVLNNTIYKGRHFPSGVIEHLTVYPDGEPCYCGKKGCLEAYCSKDALEKKYHLPIQAILNQPTYKNTYLKNLSIALNNVHLIFDLPILLGGEITHLLTIDDIETLKNMTNARSFCQTEIAVIKCDEDKDISLVGAVFPLIEKFLNNIE